MCKTLNSIIGSSRIIGDSTISEYVPVFPNHTNLLYLFKKHDENDTFYLSYVSAIITLITIKMEFIYSTLF